MLYALIKPALSLSSLLLGSNKSIINLHWGWISVAPTCGEGTKSLSFRVWFILLYTLLPGPFYPITNFTVCNEILFSHKDFRFFSEESGYSGVALWVEQLKSHRTETKVCRTEEPVFGMKSKNTNAWVASGFVVQYPTPKPLSKDATSSALWRWVPHPDFTYT